MGTSYDYAAGGHRRWVGLTFPEFVAARRRKHAARCRLALDAAQRYISYFAPEGSAPGAFTPEEAAKLAAIIDAAEGGSVPFSSWRWVDALGSHAEWWCNLVDCNQGSEDRRERHRATICRAVRGLLQPDHLAGWGWFPGIGADGV